MGVLSGWSEICTFSNNITDNLFLVKTTFIQFFMSTFTGTFLHIFGSTFCTVKLPCHTCHDTEIPRFVIFVIYIVGHLLYCSVLRAMSKSNRV